jgi:hypothetical protein
MKNEITVATGERPWISPSSSRTARGTTQPSQAIGNPLVQIANMRSRGALAKSKRPSLPSRIESRAAQRFAVSSARRFDPRLGGRSRAGRTGTGLRAYRPAARPSWPGRVSPRVDLPTVGHPSACRPTRPGPPEGRPEGLPAPAAASRHPSRLVRPVTRAGKRPVPLGLSSPADRRNRAGPPDLVTRPESRAGF